MIALGGVAWLEPHPVHRKPVVRSLARWGTYRGQLIDVSLSLPSLPLKPINKSSGEDLKNNNKLDDEATYCEANGAYTSRPFLAWLFPRSWVWP